MSRWFLVLPPDGAARKLALNLHAAFDPADTAHEVKVFDSLLYRNTFSTLLKKTTDEMIVDLCGQSLALQCLDFGAHYLLVPALSPVTVFILQLLKRYHVTTIHWFFEDYNTAHYWRDVIKGYDFFCAIQRGPLPGACARDGARYHYLPTASSINRTTVNSENGHISFDVAFIGIPSTYRISFLEYLVSSGINLVIGGYGWRHYRGPLEKHILHTHWVDDENLVKLLLSARIGLNLSKNDPRNDKKNVHLSPRVFDILSLGLVLCTENIPLFRETIPGAYAGFFDDSETGLNIIRNILSDYETHRRLSLPNIRLIGDYHTYRNRLDDIFKIAGDPGRQTPILPGNTARSAGI